MLYLTGLKQKGGSGGSKGELSPNRNRQINLWCSYCRLPLSNPGYPVDPPQPGPPGGGSKGGGKGSSSKRPNPRTHTPHIDLTTRIQNRAEQAARDAAAEILERGSGGGRRGDRKMRAQVHDSLTSLSVFAKIDPCNSGRAGSQRGSKSFIGR